MLTIGNRVKKLRELRGYSQQYMALKLAISQEQYSYLENKQKAIPVETIQKIATLLEVPHEFLLAFDPDKFMQSSNDNNDHYVELHKLIFQSHEHERKALTQLIENLQLEIKQLRAQKNSKG